MCPSPSCTPISGSPEHLRGSTMSPWQVNGVFNCLCTGSSDSRSLMGVNVEGRFGKQTPLRVCMTARICSVCKYKKRKLVRAPSVSHFSSKPLKPLAVKCSCEWPNSCVLCSCKASVQTIVTLSLEERVALLDSGFHTILSLSHGNPIHLYFETLLRGDGLHRLLSHELRTLKMSCLGKKQDPTNGTFPKQHSWLLLASHKLSKMELELKLEH
ncbi:KAT8 regulatory NSL complex subunit 1-like [Tyto alba]|uniref:KAT8 regulatory NSL complex subunit 1-like n=1 Tax=Tyto alba TaxID=56313 RepID=UPI001C68490B|nr:KAT8 regulatory NSL complex subunit 1-like [Tyto alba]